MSLMKKGIVVSVCSHCPTMQTLQKFTKRTVHEVKNPTNVTSVHLLMKGFSTEVIIVSRITPTPPTSTVAVIAPKGLTKV